jgi:hypothetical protein
MRRSDGRSDAQESEKGKVSKIIRALLILVSFAVILFAARRKRAYAPWPNSERAAVEWGQGT